MKSYIKHKDSAEANNFNEKVKEVEDMSANQTKEFPKEFQDNELLKDFINKLN